MDLDFKINQYLNASSYNDAESLETHFNSVANLLMNKSILIVDKNQYRLTEIEFYFFRSQIHEDPYIHKDELQLLTGQWYFHGSGLDITFGDDINHGGILIRGIRQINCSDHGFTSGPLRVVKEIFKSFGNTLSKDHILCISETNQLPEETVIRSTRVGLKEKDVENGSRFKNRNYRFLTFPFENYHNYTEKTLVAQAMLLEGNLKRDEINKGFKWNIIK